MGSAMKELTLYSGASLYGRARGIDGQCIGASQGVKYSIEASYSINTGMETTRSHLAV